MNKVYMTDLATHLSDEYKIDHNDAKQFIHHARDFFVESIKAKRRIEIRRFGVIRYNKLNAHTSRNPTTGERVEVGERIRPIFAPSPSTVEYL